MVNLHNTGVLDIPGSSLCGVPQECTKETWNGDGKHTPSLGLRGVPGGTVLMIGWFLSLL